MKKKLLSLAAATALILPTLSYAIGLGSVRTYSHLNERLKAEIPVLSVKKKGRITVALAPNAEFAKRGVQRSDVLNDLRFSIVKRNGRNYVQVSSAKQIAVPYLNFILQLTSPEGVVSREYAIFLDPATVGKKKRSNKPVTIVSPYRTATKSKSTIKPSSSRKATASSMQQGAAAIGVSRLKGGRYGPVARGETLWSIASRTRPSENVPVKDMVAAIRRANPRTLARQLPAGVMLNIPTISGYSDYDGKRNVATKPVKPKKRIKKTTKRPKKTTAKPAAPTVVEQPINLPKPPPSATDKVTATSAALPTLASDAPAITDKTDLSAVEQSTTGSANDNEIAKTADTTTPSSTDDATNTALNADDTDVSATSSGEDNNTDNAAAPVPASDNPAKAALETAAEPSSTASTAATETPATTGKENTEVTSTATAETTTSQTTENVVKTSTDSTENSTKKTATPSGTAVPKSTDEVMQLLQDKGPIVGGIVAVLGLGGLLLFNRRRKAKLAAIPALTGTNKVAVADEDQQIEDLFEDTDSEQASALLPPVDEIDSDETLPITDLHAASEDTSIESFDNDNAAVAAVDSVDLDLDDLGIEDFDLSDGDLNIDLDDDLLIDDHFSLDGSENDSVAGLLVEEPLSPADADSTADHEKEDDLLFDLSDDDSASIDLAETGNADVDNVELEFDIGDHDLLSNETPLFADDDSGDLLTDDDSDVDLDVLFEEDEFLSNINNEAAAVSEREELDDDALDDEDELSLDFDQEEVIKTFEAENEQQASPADISDEQADFIELQDSDADDGKAFTNRESFEALHDSGNQLSAEDWLSDADENKDILIDFDERDNQDLPTMGKNEALQADDAQDVVVADTDDVDNDNNVQKTVLTDEAANTRIQMKLDLANAFISISENHRAIDLLEEIVQTGSPEQVETAKGLLQQLNS